jgi:hypothetical protein
VKQVKKKVFLFQLQIKLFNSCVIHNY